MEPIEGAFQVPERGRVWRPVGGTLDCVEHVYFITGAGMTKVGYSTDVRSRLTSLQRRVPVDLRVTYATPGGRPLESALHRALTAQGRHVFREWFTAMSAADAKEAVRAARRLRADSSPEGVRRLLDYGFDCVRRALEHDVRSPGRGDHLDDALEAARRLDRADGPSEALHAEILAARFDFEPRERPYRPSTAPPGVYDATGRVADAPDPDAAFAPLIDL